MRLTLFILLTSLTVFGQFNNGTALEVYNNKILVGTDVTRLTFPDTLYAALGHEVVVDKSMLVIDANSYKYTMTVTGGIGTNNGQQWSYTATSTGVQEVTFSLTNMSVTSVSTIVKSVDTTGGSGNWYVNVMGDSWINNKPTAPNIRKDLEANGDITANFLGTNTFDATNHQGESGKTWNWFIGSSSPYWNTFLDINDYFTNTVSYSGSGDSLIIVCNLGINDMFNSAKLTELQVQSNVNSAKVFIDSVLLNYPTCNIILALPAICSSNRTNFVGVYGYPYENYQFNMRRYWEIYKADFDGGAYSSQVHLCVGAMGVDRDSDYTGADVIHIKAPEYIKLSNHIYGLIRNIINSY